jgi:hypothetical protein
VKQARRKPSRGAGWGRGQRRQVLRGLLRAMGASVAGGWRSLGHLVRAAPAGTPKLAELLERNRQFGPEYGGGLSNHLSMALVALQRLGASDARLAGYYRTYARRLEPPPPAGSPITRATFAAHLGTQKRYPDYLAFFHEELQRLGLQQLLATYLPPLVPGIAAAAFHGVIRLAYALQAQDEPEVALSLAYFADTYLPLGPPTGAAAIEEPPVELLRRLGRTPALAHRSWHARLISDQLPEIGVQPAFAPVIDWLPASAARMAPLAEAALLVYASTDNFTALHGLTSTHALRIAWPHVPDPAAAARYQFQALCAAYISIGTPPLLTEAEQARLTRQAVPPWSAIAAAAIRSSDEHVIKLVYSAREEDAAYGHALYRYAAAKKAGLLR